MAVKIPDRWTKEEAETGYEHHNIRKAIEPVAEHAQQRDRGCECEAKGKNQPSHQNAIIDSSIF